MKIKLERKDPDADYIGFYRVVELCKESCDIFHIGQLIVGPEGLPFYTVIERERVGQLVRMEIYVNYCGVCGEKTEILGNDTEKELVDGDECPRCGKTLEEGIRNGYVVCLNCTFEQRLPLEAIIRDEKLWRNKNE